MGRACSTQSTIESPLVHNKGPTTAAYNSTDIFSAHDTADSHGVF